jgi:hypothetical protein
MKLLNSEMLGFWGALLGAFISGVFAITIFVADRYSDKRNEKKELLSFGELYYTSIEIMQKDYVNNQILFMDSFIHEIEEKNIIRIG